MQSALKRTGLVDPVKYMQGKNAIIKSSVVMWSNTEGCPSYPPPNFGKEVDNVVGLPEVVLNVVVFGRDAQLDKLLLKGAGLLKKAMHLAFYFHRLNRQIVRPPHPLYLASVSPQVQPLGTLAHWCTCVRQHHRQSR